jgi:formylmethanofuran dehydrogenase subunit E
MNLEKHNRSVELRCSTCGGDQFRRDDALENGPIECGSCGRTFSREELIRENGEIIEKATDEMKADIIAEVRGDFRKMFRNSKFIKVRRH